MLLPYLKWIGRGEKVRDLWCGLSIFSVVCGLSTNGKKWIGLCKLPYLVVKLWSLLRIGLRLAEQRDERPALCVLALCTVN